MPANLRFKWKGDDLLKATVPAANKGLTAVAAYAANFTVESVLSKHASPPSSPAGEPPGYDQSFLRNSIAFASPEALGTPLHAAYGTAVRYGRFLETGGIITAKKGKFLAVPVDRLLARKVMRSNTTANVYRWSGFTDVDAGLRKNPLLQFIPSKKGGGVLVLKSSVRIGYGARLSKIRGKKSETFKPGTVVFALKKRVSIKARPWIKRAAAQARPEMERLFVNTVKRELIAAGAVEREA